MDFNKIVKNMQDKIKKMKKSKKMDKNTILMGLAVLCVLATVVLVVMNLVPSDKAIAQKSLDYINKNLLQGQSTATLGAVSREEGLIKFQVSVSGQTFDSYATKDGKLFFPTSFKLNEAPQLPSAAQTGSAGQ